MSRTSRWYALLLTVLLAVACGDGTDIGSPQDGGTDDAGLVADGGTEDAGITDAGTEDGGTDDGGTEDGGTDDGGTEDGGTGDGGTAIPAPGFGEISGDCWILDDELTSAHPFIFQNSLDFGTDPYDDADLPLLTAGGQEIIADGNAGGSSLLSEVFAYELLERCEGAALLATEMEVAYVNPQGPITDLLVDIDGLKVGVSVTRAIAWPFDEPYPYDAALSLVEKKLGGILDSTANVAEEHRWVKQILHVLAYSPDHAATFTQAWNDTTDTLRADTVVIVTVTDGDDAPLY